MPPDLREEMEGMLAMNLSRLNSLVIPSIAGLGLVFRAAAEISEAPPHARPCDFDSLDPLAGFEARDPMEFIEAPDGFAARATAPFENSLVGKLAREQIQGPLTKTYCELGLMQMIVDYQHEVEDGAVRAVGYRTVYRWQAEAEFPGWELHQWGMKNVCARGKDEDTNLCN